MFSDSTSSDTRPWSVIHLPDYAVVNNTWGFGKVPEDAHKIQIIFGFPEGVGWSVRLPKEFDPAEVISYPQVFTGMKDHNLLTNHLSKPRQLSEYHAITQRWTWDVVHSEDAQFNVASEIFFHNSPDIHLGWEDGEYHPEKDTREYELMVWERKPDDSRIGLGTRVLTDPDLGVEAYVWDDRPNYMALRVAPSKWRQINWTRAIQFQHRAAIEATRLGIENRRIQSSWYLGAVEAGTEMWAGDLDFRVNDFEVTVVLAEGEPYPPLEPPAPAPSETNCRCRDDAAYANLTQAQAELAIAERKVREKDRRVVRNLKKAIETVRHDYE